MSNFMLWRYINAGDGEILFVETEQERDDLVAAGCQDVTGMSVIDWEYPQPKARKPRTRRKTKTVTKVPDDEEKSSEDDET